eukprot:CAMPEP_0202701774 /NCGR_PEP_ID=MMETSP1385-20130828/14826_1 /ASSEMBLY_ACC=CAM_ASM_000861 /TAXON_ID=933848 /ORGANISM="Elphidium margaritaceum" /LENGTH=286 /DNA_ID=CAMNT_0049359259 /DNA_START=35 /DNA_END=895 /DNA_ORIENTATION=-
MTVIDLYLKEMRQHWWLHFLTEGSVHFWVLTFLLWSVFAILKARKLKRIGECAEGIVVDKYAQIDRNTSTTRYTIKYIFMPESTKQSNALVYGYCKHESASLYIPSAIMNEITLYHGSRHFGTGCIVEEKTISKQHYSNLEIGDKIEIVFNPKNPKMMQIPKMTMDSAHARKVALCICSVVCLTLLMAYYCAVFIFGDMHSTARWKWYVIALNGVLLFLSYAVSIGLIVASCFCCYFRYKKTREKRLNSQHIETKYEQVIHADAADDDDDDSEPSQDPLLSISITS